MPHATLAEHALVDNGHPWRRRQIETSCPSRSTTKVIGKPVLISVYSCRASKLLIGIAVDRFDEIARLESGRRRWAVRLDAADPRHVLHPAEGHEHPGEYHESQNEICDRPSENDRRAAGQRLAG